MKYFLETSGGRSFEIEVHRAAEGVYELRWDGRTVRAEFDEVDRQGQYSVRLEARSYAAAVEEHSATDLAVLLAGESFRFAALDLREKAAGQVVAARPKRGEVLTAPIPGVVASIAMVAGDRVEPGQAVVVLEAMKMQNEIASVHGGVVADVMVSVGDAVSVNQPLAKVDPV